MTTTSINDNRNDAERRYDAIRDGTFYSTPLELVEAPAAVDAELAILERDPDAPDKAHEKVLIGHIDGCHQVRASYLNNGELYCASATWNGLHMSTDGADYINIELGEGLGGSGSMHLHEWPLMIDLVQAGVVEQLVMLARQYATVSTLSAACAPLGTSPIVLAPAVRVENLYRDLNHPLQDVTNQPGVGPLAYTSYVAGVGDDQVELTFTTNGSFPPKVYMYGSEEPLDQVERVIANLQLLLADPRVVAARAAYAAQHRL